MRRRALAVVCALMAAAAAAPAADALLPAVHHVYVIVLENESVATSFGAGSPAPYLSRTLRAAGAYVPKYYGTGHESNDNYIAMISGQAPNVAQPGRLPVVLGLRRRRRSAPTARRGGRVRLPGERARRSPRS